MTNRGDIGVQSINKQLLEDMNIECGEMTERLKRQCRELSEFEGD
jgi:hypothetical protein